MGKDNSLQNAFSESFEICTGFIFVEFSKIDKMSAKLIYKSNDNKMYETVIPTSARGKVTFTPELLDICITAVGKGIDEENSPFVLQEFCFKKTKWEYNIKSNFNGG